MSPDNVPGHGDEYKLETRRMAVRLYTEGIDERGPLSTQEIADVLGVSRQRVEVYLDDMGVALRKRGAGTHRANRGRRGGRRRGR